MTTLSDEQVRLNLANLLNDVVADGFDEVERAALRAAIERFTPPTGDLGEAVERLESAVLMAESPVGATVTTRDVRVEDIRRVLAAVQGRQEPEADPNDVNEFWDVKPDRLRVILGRWEAERDTANQIIAAIRVILKKQGESNDGKTE